MSTRLFYSALGVGLLVLQACSPRFFVYELAPEGHDAGDTSFETERLQLNYNFWADGGAVHYTARNLSADTLCVSMRYSFVQINTETYTLYHQLEHHGVLNLDTLPQRFRRAGSDLLLVLAPADSFVFHDFTLWPHPCLQGLPRHPQRKRKNWATSAQTKLEQLEVNYHTPRPNSTPLTLTTRLVYRVGTPADSVTETLLLPHWAAVRFNLVEVGSVSEHVFLAGAATPQPPLPFYAPNRFYRFDTERQKRQKQTAQAIGNTFLTVVVVGLVAVVSIADNAEPVD